MITTEKNLFAGMNYNDFNQMLTRYFESNNSTEAKTYRFMIEYNTCYALANRMVKSIEKVGELIGLPSEYIYNLYKNI